MDSIINYASEKNTPGLPLFLDFQKAFDTLEWSFSRKPPWVVMDLGLSSWTGLTHFIMKRKAASQTMAGRVSSFKLGRGVRQGCPLSPYLFILAIELLATAIRQNKKITGITINKNEFKISQYADDTIQILDGSETSLVTALETVETFGKISGLWLNSKTNRSPLDWLQSGGANKTMSWKAI